MIVNVGALIPGTTVRASTTARVAAGKGVNAAVGVAALGGHSIATGFIGVQSRDVFRSLTAEGVEPRFVEVEGETRANFTVLEANGRETHIQTTGYSVSPADTCKLVALIEETVAEGDVVVIGGSYPPGTPLGLARDLVRDRVSRRAYVILDASGPALIDGLSGGPSMVKPNMKELAEIVGRTVPNSDYGAAAAATECLSFGVERVVVSRGHLGLLVVERGEALKASVDMTRLSATASVGSGRLCRGCVCGLCGRWPPNRRCGAPGRVLWCCEPPYQVPRTVLPRHCRRFAAKSAS